ncbi:hypothetical protein WDU94_004089 [Cyamophila willieti]
MESPIPTVIMVGIYLYIVIFLGPWLMANRKPFKLKTVLVVYNAAQVIFSLAMLWEVSTYLFLIFTSEYSPFLFFCVCLFVCLFGLYVSLPSMIISSFIFYLT